MHRDEMKGIAKETSGKVKSALGALSDDQQLEAEGASDRMSGKIQKNVGKVKEGIQRALD